MGATSTLSRVNFGGGGNITIGAGITLRLSNELVLVNGATLTGAGGVLDGTGPEATPKWAITGTGLSIANNAVTLKNVVVDQGITGSASSFVDGVVINATSDLAAATILGTFNANHFAIGAVKLQGATLSNATTGAIDVVSAGGVGATSTLNTVIVAGNLTVGEGITLLVTSGTTVTFSTAAERTLLADSEDAFKASTSARATISVVGANVLNVHYRSVDPANSTRAAGATYALAEDGTVATAAD